jgi:hypothetical protein
MARPKLKWKFAIGTTSLVPFTSPQLHYLIMDIDCKPIPTATLKILAEYNVRYRAYETQHGWHIYTSCAMPWSLLIRCLNNVPGVDQQWLRIGKRRGYFFLADKELASLPWPTIHMVLHHRKARHGRPSR